METIVIGGVVVMLVLGVLVNVWRWVVRAFTGIFVLGAVVLVLGYLFGGAEAITDPTASGWSAILDSLIWEGSGERIVNAVVNWWQTNIEIIQKYY